MVNPFDRKALAVRLAARKQALAEPQALKKVGLKLSKAEAPAEKNAAEWAARFKANRR